MEYRRGVFGIHADCQPRKELGPLLSPSSAAFQLLPPSSETSTLTTFPYPLNAIPRSVTPSPAGIFELPSGEIRNDRTGIRPIGMVFTFPAFMSSGVVVPRGVAGMRYAVFIQKLSSGVSSARIQETDLVQYVEK